MFSELPSLLALMHPSEKGFALPLAQSQMAPLMCTSKLVPWYIVIKTESKN